MIINLYCIIVPQYIMSIDTLNPLKPWMRATKGVNYNSKCNSDVNNPPHYSGCFSSNFLLLAARG